MTDELDFLRWQDARSKCNLSFAQRDALMVLMRYTKKLLDQEVTLDLAELCDLDLIEEAYAWGLRTAETVYWVEGVLGDNPAKRLALQTTEAVTAVSRYREFLKDAA